MDPESSNNESENLKVMQQAIHFTVGRICEEVGAVMDVSFSKEVMATLADVTYTQLETYSEDLCAFSKHAKRTTVNTDDVTLLVRRNKSFREHIRTKASSLEAAAPDNAAKTKKSKKN